VSGPAARPRALLSEQRRSAARLFARTWRIAASNEDRRLLIVPDTAVVPPLPLSQDWCVPRESSGESGVSHLLPALLAGTLRLSLSVAGLLKTEWAVRLAAAAGDAARHVGTGFCHASAQVDRSWGVVVSQLHAAALTDTHARQIHGDPDLECGVRRARRGSACPCCRGASRR
jgi:hypothetical protein